METQPHHSIGGKEAVILLNPSACGGTALRKWKRISTTVRERLGEMKVVAVNGRIGIPDMLPRFTRAGYTRFVAAGGDGTVNAAVQALMNSGQAPRCVLGAIALGSSNDYHKPFRPDQQLSGISCKIDFNRAQERDVGMVGFEDEDGHWRTRYWIINAGLGITAEANAFFNRPNALLEHLKRRSTATAILYAAVRTLLRFHSEHRLLQVASQPGISANVTNLGVVKSPHFSGGFSYDSELEPASGRFYVHLAEDMSLPLALFTLWQLSHRHFSGLPHTRSWQTNHLLVSGERPFAIELDGEVVHSRKVAFAIADQRLEVCV